jgi:hypothetical protein
MPACIRVAKAYAGNHKSHNRKDKEVAEGYEPGDRLHDITLGYSSWVSYLGKDLFTWDSLLKRACISRRIKE